MIESILVILLVGLAGTYLVGRMWQMARSARRQAGDGCGHDCGCSSEASK